MSTTPSIAATLDNPAAKRRSWLRRAGLAAVVLVPLAFAGLFVGALGQSDTAIDRIPAAIVNEDELIQMTNADGSESPVFAGRQLVTELTAADGFDWVITNADDAEAALRAGEVYAVLTIPQNFSESILSLSGERPEQADLSIRTDDTHGYLSGSVAQVVGQSMTDTFGKTITSQYIGGIYASLGELGESLTEAADGATALADGATGLSGGLAQYTGGVSDLSDGLYQLEDGAADLASGVAGYTGGVSQLSASLSQLNQGIQPNPTVDPAIKAGLQQVVDGLASAAANGPALASGATQLSDGVSQSADGAAQLSAGSAPLVDGAAQLSSGASDLATGLREGATQLTGADTPAGDPDIAADPVTLSVTTDNEVSQVGQLVATFFVPLGLWIGALAVFLVLRPLTRRALASTARNGRLVFSGLARAGAVTGAQAVLLTVLLHSGLGVNWALLPATLGFSLLMALAFTAFHYLLTIGLGRAGLVVSLFVLAVQVTSTGGIYPVEVLSAPFQAISPFLPLTWAVEGMQGIIAGGSAGGVVAASIVLAAFGAGSALVALLAIRRTRRATALGLVPQLS